MSDSTPPPPSDHARVPTAPAGDDVAAVALARVRDVTSELVRLVRAAASQATDGWSIVTVLRPLVPELERVFEERDVFEQEVRALRTDVADADERIRELETQLAARETGWNAERAMLETEVARERERAQVLSEDLERRRAEGELLATRERRVRQQMESIAARAHTDREETLRLARDMVQAAEEARLAVVDEMDRLRGALAAEQASLLEVEHERARASQGEAEREAELARTRQLVDQIETSRANATSELARARASLVHTESELLAAQHEYQLAQVQIDKLCIAHDELVEDRAQLVARLHEAKQRDARLRLRITGLERRVQAAHEGTAVGAEPASEPALDAATSEIALELSRAEERARVLESELVKAKAAASAAALRADSLQEQARTADQSRAAAEWQARSLRATVDELNRAGATDKVVVLEPANAPVAERADHAEPPSHDVEPLELVPVSADGEPVLTADSVANDTLADAAVGDLLADAAVADPIDASSLALESPPVCDDEPETALDDVPAPVAVTGRVAVLDVDDTWSAGGDVESHVVSLDETVVERVREIDPACCMVNVAVPGAIEAAAALRAGGIATPFWGYVAELGAALTLGPIDVVTRPVDPDAVRGRLVACATAGANVIMVGSESSILIPLRQGVQQAGMSVRTAWNRTQAVELAAARHPDVVILDVAADGAAGLAGELARGEGAPRIVLVAGTAAHHEELGAALRALAREGAPLDRDELRRAAIAAR